ncbi:MAG: hypothetical protein ACE5K4_05100 [Candidatus Hydrothermarchaeota archaeon]
MSSDTLIEKFKVYMLAFSIITGLAFTLMNLRSPKSSEASGTNGEIFDLQDQVKIAIEKAQNEIEKAEKKGKDIIYAEEALKNARKLSETHGKDKYEFRRNLLEAIHYAKRAESLAKALTDVSCVSCHSSLKNTEVYAEYVEWAETVHADNFVTCEKCHGGNPDEKTAHKDLLHLNISQITRVCSECHPKSKYFESAHWEELRKTLELNSNELGTKFNDQVLAPACTTCHGGHRIKSTRNPESTVFFKKVTETCGIDCHPKQYSEFVKSTHYKRLSSDKLGPTCVTCHGSHSASIPENISGVCGYCHSEVPEVRGRWHEFKGKEISFLESYKPKTMRLLVRIR